MRPLGKLGHPLYTFTNRLIPHAFAREETDE